MANLKEKFNKSIIYYKINKNAILYFILRNLKIFIIFAKKYNIYMKLNKIHHIAVICSDYEKSKHLYTDVLGMKIMVCR